MQNERKFSSALTLSVVTHLSQPLLTQPAADIQSTVVFGRVKSEQTQFRTPLADKMTKENDRLKAHKEEL
jgi:hypothetical protein